MQALQAELQSGMRLLHVAAAAERPATAGGGSAFAVVRGPEDTAWLPPPTAPPIVETVVPEVVAAAAQKTATRLGMGALRSEYGRVPRHDRFGRRTFIAEGWMR